MEMLVEKTREKALQGFLNGDEVLVLTKFDDGSMVVEDLDDVLPEDSHYLVDVMGDMENIEGVQPSNQIENEVKAVVKQQYDDSLREQAAKLKSEGKNMKEISALLDIPYRTVYGWLGKKPKAEKPGSNADRHLCRTCQYRGCNTGTIRNGCDYIEIAGHSRGCSVEECSLYKRGKRIKINTHAVRNGLGNYEE